MGPQSSRYLAKVFKTYGVSSLCTGQGQRPPPRWERRSLAFSPHDFVSPISNLPSNPKNLFPKPPNLMTIGRNPQPGLHPFEKISPNLPRNPQRGQRPSRKFAEKLRVGKGPLRPEIKKKWRREGIYFSQDYTRMMHRLNASDGWQEHKTSQVV
ncbi:hypothetical protein AVEN_124037-1 [Araneus ventricosus]|uniref:Uncharacterized protein n=1 Tax=Araneus ventricosus TaxID=182803 RepID=A0A4Y2PYA1_ARAVE|nr:hypothetical protein AVEN_124037-1 [Araneus ventricosus]